MGRVELMGTYHETFICKNCSVYTYVLGKLGYSPIANTILSQFEDRYEKKLCPKCYKEDNK